MLFRSGRAVLNQHIFRTEHKVSNLYNPYLEIAINEALIKLIVQAHGGVGLQHITKTKLEKTTIKVPFFGSVPDIRIQKNIVKKINKIKLNSEFIKIRCQEQLNNFNKLKQSILNQAFQGKL